jgi:hypothetical protein
MATIVLRAGKGSPLTNAEVDANFSNINNELVLKLPLSGGTLTGALNVNFSNASYSTPVSYSNTAAGGGAHSVLLFASTLGNAVAGDSMITNSVGNMIISPNAAGKALKLVGGVWTNPVGITITESGVDLRSGTTINSNVALHAGNYNSYAPTLTGTGASGTWGINISGSAGNALLLPTAYIGGQQLNPQTYFSQSTGLRVAMTAAAGVWSDTLWVNGYSGGDVLDMCALHFQRNGTPRMYISTQQSTATSYGTLYEVLSSYNYNSYSPSLTGSGASGTWGINITGNATRAVDDSLNIRIANPGGAAYSYSAGGVTGAIKVRLPAAANNCSTMMRFTVCIYNYSAGTMRTFEIGGYNYAGGYWVNVSATQSTQAGGDMTVRFGYDGTSQCVWIGETNATWLYPQVFVRDFQGGFGNTSSAIWATGWSISVVTAFDTVQDYVNAAQPLSAYNYSSYALPLSGGTIASNGYIDFGPNTSWGATLRVGGNGHGGTGRASVVTTDGNLHLDGAAGHGIYLGYYVNGPIYATSNLYNVLHSGNITSYALPVMASGTITEFGQTISANYTVTSGKNALSAGPITVNDGVTVTVPDGCAWVIV